MFGLFKQQHETKHFNAQCVEISCEWQNKLGSSEPQYCRTFIFEDQSKVYGFLFEIIQVHSDLFFISASCCKDSTSVDVSVKSKTRDPVPKIAYQGICQDIECVFKHALMHDTKHH